MKCVKCNSNINKNEKFCSNCGNEVNKSDNTFAIVSIIVGVISFLGGFFFIPLPIIGLVLALKQKDKSTESIIGIIINSISLFFAIISLVIIISLIRYIPQIGKEFVDELKEDINEEYESEFGVINGTWYFKGNSINLYNNKYTLYNNEEESNGVYIVYDIDESEVEEDELLDIRKLIDGNIDEEKLYYVLMVNSKETNKELWFKIKDKDEFFVYNLNNKTFEYYSKTEINEYE